MSPRLAGQRPPSASEEVAIVHDYLNQTGGAERVVLELSQIWPQAPIYTSLYRPASTFARFADLEIRASLLDRLPVDGGFRGLAPLYPLAFRSMGTLPHRLVISSSSGWAHGVRTRPDAFHVVYCHNPARWIYQREEHVGRQLQQLLLRPALPALRRWDRAAAARPNLYIANCEGVRRRVRHAYGRDAIVVYPPVDVDRFWPQPAGQRLLVVSRLLPYKRVDLIVRAASRAKLGLDVVGIGPSLPALREMAGPQVTFHGRVGDDSLRELLENCRALCMAAAEDFGITPLEANAAGKVVVAYGAGGVLETLQDGSSASFFRERSVEAVLEALRRAETMSVAPEALAANADRFSAAAFRQRFRQVVESSQRDSGSS